VDPGSRNRLTGEHVITTEATPRAATLALFAIVMMFVTPGAAHANVFFDRAFGVGVDTGADVFENCTIASGCQGASNLHDAGAMDDPNGMAVDAKGGIVVADRGNSRIDRFVVRPDGTVVFDRAFGVDVDPSDGTTGDFENCTITCQAGTASAVAGGLARPEDVAVDAQGRILVSDQNGHRVSRFVEDADGTVSFDRAFGVDVDPSDGDTGDFENCTTTSGCRSGTATDAAGGIGEGHGVAVDAQGRILVADATWNRIDRFAVASDGSVSFDRAFGIDVDPHDGHGGVFDNCTAASGCQLADSSGTAGAVRTPQGVTADSQGRILVTEQSNHRVSRFTVAGDGSVAFDRAFGVDVNPSDGHAGGFENCTTASGCQGGTPTDAAGGLNTPGGIAVDSQGRVLVADDSYHRIDRFAVAADGSVTFERSFGIDVDPSDGDTGDFENCTTSCKAGTDSSAAGGFSFLRGVAVDAAGGIFVSDGQSNRINLFQPPQVTVRATLVPAGDSGRFDLQVNGTVVAAGVGDGASGRAGAEPPDAVTISERAAAGTSLSDYDTTIDCGDGPHGGSSLTIPPLTGDVTCTITNTRKPTASVPSGSSGTVPGGGATGATGGNADVARPTLTYVSLTNKTFAVDTHGAAETLVAARAKRGTVVRYTLSEKARVVVEVERATVGRKVGSSCRKETKSNRKRKPCTLYVPAGNFAVQSAAGTDQHAFSGKIGHKSLVPGTYRASLVAIDAARNRSVARRIAFRIVKR
jgi:hypothetical protein